MFFTAKSDLKCVEKTLKLLAGYHAVPISDPMFIKKYGHLIVMYNNLCNKTGHKSCLEI